jgi:hypothetical protein
MFHQLKAVFFLEFATRIEAFYEIESLSAALVRRGGVFCLTFRECGRVVCLFCYFLENGHLRLGFKF